jgi:hypothetical protein
MIAQEGVPDAVTTAIADVETDVRLHAEDVLDVERTAQADVLEPAPEAAQDAEDAQAVLHVQDVQADASPHVVRHVQAHASVHAAVTAEADVQDAPHTAQVLAKADAPTVPADAEVHVQEDAETIVPGEDQDAAQTVIITAAETAEQTVSQLVLEPARHVQGHVQEDVPPVPMPAADAQDAPVDAPLPAMEHATQHVIIHARVTALPRVPLLATMSARDALDVQGADRGVMSHAVDALDAQARVLTAAAPHVLQHVKDLVRHNVINRPQAINK